MGTKFDEEADYVVPGAPESKAKHTPGPWVSYGVKVHLVDSDGVVRRDIPETVANARLIAAAPDLLAALDFVDKWYAMRMAKGEMFPGQLIDSVRAAIAKARGE